MKKNEQITFVCRLIGNVKKDIIKKMKKHNLPENWDGIELRELIANEFACCVIKNTMTKKRKKDYNNYRIVNGF